MRKSCPAMNKEKPRTRKKKKNKTKALRNSMPVSVPGPCDALQSVSALIKLILCHSCEKGDTV